MVQRAFDLIFGVFLLILLLPFLLVISLILLLTGEGEVIYKQKRIGFHGNPINVYKFATMLKNSASIGTGTITVKNDPRVLPVGKFLRVTKLNETLQLINIIEGTMSFVGPRPLTEENWNYYDPDQKRMISKVKPGLTGLGSIYFRDEEKYLLDKKNIKKSYKEKITPIKGALEVWYVQNRSIILYFLIIFLTAWAVVFKSSEFPRKLVLNLSKVKT